MSNKESIKEINNKYNIMKDFKLNRKDEFGNNLEVVNGIVGYYYNAGGDEPYFMELEYYNKLNNGRK